MTPMQQDQQHQPKPQPTTPQYKPPMGPRATGAMLAGAGFALEGLNGAFLVNDGTYYPKLLIIGMGLIPFGLWSVVTGIAYDKNNPVKPPVWWTVGAVILGIGGVALGVALSVAISD